MKLRNIKLQNIFSRNSTLVYKKKEAYSIIFQIEHCETILRKTNYFFAFIFYCLFIYTIVLYFISFKNK